MPKRFIPALILVITGILTISFRTSLNNIILNQSTFWAIAGAIAGGVSDTISKSLITNFSTYEFIFALGISQVILSFVLNETIITSGENPLSL